MNEIFVLGRLGRDPRISVSSAGTRIATFSVGTNYTFGGEKQTVWFNCVAYEGKTRKWLIDSISRLSKGQQILVRGSMRTYRNSDDIEVWQLVVDGFHYADSKNDGHRDRQDNATPSPKKDDDPLDEYDPFENE